MLKTQHTTDYLKKEGINLEIAESVEEEHTWQQALERRSILKRFKRSDEQDKIFKNGQLFNSIRKNKPQNEKLAKIKKYLDEGADVNAGDANDKNNRPLHIAALKGEPEIVDLLLKEGAKTDIPNDDGKTPLDIVEDLNNQVIMEKLQEHSELGLGSSNQQGVQPPEQQPQQKRHRSGSDENTQEDSSPKKPRVSTPDHQFMDVDVEEQPSHSKRKYAKSGLVYSLHGDIYQLKLLMLFVTRGLNKGYPFELATEMDAAEKFDDLVFKYKKSENVGHTYRFLQAKHKQDESKKIAINDLLTARDGEFSLQKYFTSYRKIEQNQEFESSQLKDFVICTNIDFKFGDKRADLELSENLFDKEIDKSDILDIELSRFKDSFAGKKQIISVLKNTPDLMKLAKTLVECVLDGRSISDDKSKSDSEGSLFKSYQAALVKEVIDTNNKKLHANFVNDENLSQVAKNFRDAFEQVFNDRKKSFKLENNPSISQGDLENFTGEIATLITGAQPNGVVTVTKRKHVIKNNIHKLAGYVLIKKGNEVQFSSAFLNSAQLPGNLNDFRNKLRDKLSQNINLGQYKFKINEFKTCEEIYILDDKALLEEIGKRELKLFDNFGKANINIESIEKFTEKFVELLEESKSKEKKVVKIKRKDVIAKNIDKLAQYALVEKDGKIQFSSEFLSNIQLPGNLNDFRSQLRAKLEELNFDLNVLNEYQFDISNFPKFDLPDDDVNTVANDIENFLNHLRFAVNQPDEKELGEIIKEEIGKEFNNVDRKNVYGRLLEGTLDWMKEKEGSFFSHEEGKAFFEEIKKEILGAVCFNVKDPVSSFTGREQELGILHDKIQRGSEKVTVISQMTSISGLGGIGKTELARKYVQGYSWNYDDNVLWINAESEVALIESFFNLARDNRLGITTKEKPIENIVKEIYRFFAKKKSLFIFDNAEKKEYLNKFLPLRTLKPSDNKPYILITSREKEWEKGIEVVELKVLKLEDAIEFVKNGLGISKDDKSQDQEIENLVEKLQRFPLTIQQAIAYIKDQKITGEFSVDDYLKEYERKTKDLLNTDVFKGIDNDYAKTTFTTWKITIDKIASNEEYGKLALKILDVMAYVGHENINREIFLSLVEGDERKLKSAVRLLVKYSMIDGEQGQSVLSIHKLVQEVTRLELRGQNKEEDTIGKAFNILEESFHYGGDTLEDYAKKRQLLPHLEAYLSHIDDWVARKPGDKQRIEKDYLENLLAWMSGGYSGIGNPMRAKELLERALAIQEKHYGPDHFEVARALGNLGNAYRALGNHQKQKELLERALPIFEKHFDHEHFEVAITLVILGNAYGALGDNKKQKELLERALPIFEKHFGLNHFEVARTLRTLANVYGVLGDLQKQKELLERALLIFKKYFDHYDHDGFQVASALVILGSTYGALGDLQKQKELLERALPVVEKHFDPEHFEVAKILGMLGSTYGALGDLQKQKELLERALPIVERHFGLDHFEVAITLENLGNTYGALGNHQKQKELLERALPIFEKHFGLDHPQTLRTRNNVAVVLASQGKYDEALQAYREVLDIQKKPNVLGPDHPETLRTRNNIAVVFASQGKYDEALQAYQEVFDIQKKPNVLGSNHPETLGTRNNMAGVLNAQGNYEEALKAYREVLEKRKQTLGPDHPDTLATMHDMARVLSLQGNYEGALRIYQEILEKFKQTLGPDHLYTLSTIHEIAKVLDYKGNYEEALRVYQEVLEKFKYISGSDHLAILEVMHDIAHALDKQENYEEALKTYQEVLEKRKKVLGHDHPDTLTTRNGIAKVLQKQGKNDEALKIFKEVYGKRKEKLGEDHPDTLTTRNGIAEVLEKQGKNYEALKIFEEVYEKRKEKLRDHPDTLKTKENIDRIQTILGKESNIQIQSNRKQQKAFVRLGKFIDSHISETEINAIKQGLYLPSFKSRDVKINGKCAAITRMFSQGLFLEQQDRKAYKFFLNNLQTSAELYERIVQGKQLSSREEKEIFALSRLLDGAEEELNSPASSLPSSLSHIKSYKTLDDLSLYISGLTDDFAIHLVTSNHVVAVYRRGGTYTYFDSNVALVSDLKNVDQLMKVVEKGVKYAGYELAEEGFLVEHFDVTKANNALTPKQKEILTKPIQTERHLLSLQDQEHGLIDVNDEKVSRVTLYDMGAKLHSEGSAPVLINSEMSSKDLAQNLGSGKIKITAREYLQNLKGNKKEAVQDLVQKMSSLPFSGSINEVKDAQTIQNLVLSENGQRLNSYELNKILSGPIEQSIKALPYYLEVANTKHWPNRLTNAAGRISMAKGLYDVAHSIRYGDTEGFLLGSGEIGFSLFSQLIEDGIVKVTPQFIKQMKHGIFLSRGFAGVISTPFDIYDLIRSSIDLSKAEKGSKEWRDSIAGVVLSGTSVTTAIAFTALGKPGVGTVVGLGIIIGQGFYSGTSMVIEYKKYKLTTNQEFRLFWNTFALQLPPEDVQYLAARQDVVNGLAEQAWEYLQNNTQVAAYAMGLGEISFKDNDLTRVKRMVVDIEQSMTGARVRHNVYVPEHNDLEEAIKDIIPKPKTVVVNPSSASIGMNNPSNEREGKNLSRIVPKSPSPEAQMLCLPEFTHRDYEYDNEKPIYSNSSTAIYNCRNAMIVGRKHDTRENPMMVFDLSLVNGSGLIVSSSQYRNQFNIAQGGTKIYGGNYTSNVFTLTNDNFFGTVIGGTTNATNVLDVSQLKSKGLSYENNTITTQEAQMTAKNINHFIGRNSADEHVDCQNMNNKMVVDSRGGRNSDVISNCKQVVVTGNTKVVSNESDNTFYIKPSNGYAEINGEGKGFIIFSDTALLEKASNISYLAANNTLSLQINLQEDNGKNNGTFTLDIHNYLGRENNHNYVLIDKYGSVIEPLIQPNSTEVTNFNLKAETNLTTNAEVAERYQEISQTNSAVNYTVYGVMRDLAEHYTIYGSKDSDVIPLTKNVTFAQGNGESDVYTLMPEEEVNVTINNYDEKKAPDMLYLPMQAEVEKVENDLHISTGNAIINVENYFRNSSYRHLTVIDKNKNTFLPWSNNQSYVQLVPFFHATKDQYIFLLSAEKVRNNPEVIVDSKLDDIRFYRDENDLVLVDDKPLIIKVENFYGNQYGNFTLNFRNQDKLSSKQLFELAKIAINYQDEIRSAYYNSFREYRVSAFNSTIHHNQKFVNGSLVTVEPNDKRVGVLLLQDTADMEVSTDNNDLVFFVAQSNATFVIKNWNDTDHRIFMLKFGDEIEVRKLDKFDLSEVSEIQSLIDKAAISNAVDQQLERLDNEVVNGLKYLLASNGIVNKVNVYDCLGFDSIEDQQEFVAAYSTFYSKDKLQEILQDSQVVEALILLIAKGHINLSLKDPGKEKLKDLDQCFGAKNNFTIKNGNDRVSVLKFNQSIEVDLSEVSEIQSLIGKYGISNIANQQLEKLGNEVVNDFKYLLVSINIENGIDVYNCLAEKDTQKILNPYYYEWVNWNLVKDLIEEKKVDVNAKANDVNTLLHEAASSGNLGIVQYLIDEKKVDINTKANDGRTPLHHAAASGSLNLVKYLVDEKEVDVNTKDNNGKTALHYAAYSGNLDLVKYLEKSVDINTKDNDGNTILHEAASSGNLDLVNYFIGKGADVNTKTKGHWTPLHKAAEKGNEKIVLALLEKGVDVNEKTNGGYTALHWAALNGNKETVLALLNNGANVNAKIDSGETPLHLAASKGNKEAVLALLNKGADVKVKDDSGWTPLRTAEHQGKGEIVILLSSTISNSSEVNQTTIHRIRHRHRQQNTTTHQRSRRAINEENIASSATRVGSRINDLFGWVRSSIGGLFNSRDALPENNTTQGSISQVDAQVNVDGTIMLLDFLIRKVTGQKHIPSVDQPISLLEAQGYASSITLEFDTLLKRTARSCGIQDANFNPMVVQSAIVKQVRNGTYSEISKTLYSSAEKACPEFKQTDKFLARLKNNLEEVLAEKEVELLVGKQKGLSKGISNNRLVEKSIPQVKIDNKPNTFLNDTSTSKQLSYVEKVKAESSWVKSGVRIG